VASIDGKRADGSAIRAIPLQLTFEGRAPVDTYLFAVEIEDGGTLYYDFAGERFDSVEDWHNNTRLPPARYTYTGVSVSDDNDRSDSQFISPLGPEADYQFVTGNTKSVADTTWENISPFLRPVGAVVGGILIIVPEPATTGAGWAIVGAVGASQVYEGGSNLYQIGAHGGDWTDFSDPRVKTDVLNLGEGLLSTASVGSRFLGARGLIKPAGFVQTAAGVGGKVEDAYDVYETAALAHMLYTDWDSLSASQRAQMAAVLGLKFTGDGLVVYAGNRSVFGTEGDGATPTVTTGPSGVATVAPPRSVVEVNIRRRPGQPPDLVLEPVLSPGRIDHALHGNINGYGQATGGHYQKSGTVLITNEIETDANGVLRAESSIRGPGGGWIPRLKPNGDPAVVTFFPQWWTQRQTTLAIDEAYKNSHAVPNGDDLPIFWRGTTADGIEIQGRYKVSGEWGPGWSNAYPLFED